MTARVLVVDDHESWRRGICSVLRRERRWNVVGQAADAPDAIEKAGSLQPDLILLDVELPTLSGIEAARQILAGNPRSKILFVSAHQSLDVAEAAMCAGARGYIVKSDAGFELLPAMAAIVEGRRFMGAMLTGRTVNGRPQAAPKRNCHVAGFYADDASLLEDYARVAKDALDAGKAFIIAAGETRRNALRQRLQSLGLDVDRVTSERRYLSLDTAATLAEVLIDGWPDEDRFWKSATALVFEAARASSGECPLVVGCGEVAATLLSEGKADAAIRLEQLWDELAAVYNVDIFCGYPLSLPHDLDSAVFERIRHEHSAVRTG